MWTFPEAQNWLNQLKSEAQFFKEGKATSLKPTNKILDLLKRPDKSFDWRVIVGGTAGKGTVCSYVEQTLLNNNHSVAVISSPHLQSVTERIRINGKLISAPEFAKTIWDIKEIITKNNLLLTYYEVLVVAGILAAKNNGCQVLIGEIGLGGSLDAVNAIQGKRIAALTFIGEDHLDILGPTLADVAKTKAGIFTNETLYGFTYEQKYYSEIQKNASTEIDVIKGLKNKMNKKIARKICKKITKNDLVMTHRKSPARWEKIKEQNKTLTLDGSHSKPRFEYILPKIKKQKEGKIAIIGMTKNHDPKSLKIILDSFEEIIWTTVPGERVFWSSSELQNASKRGLVSKNPTEALKTALNMPQKYIYVLGSFYLCGIARESYYPTDKIIEQQTEFPA